MTTFAVTFAFSILAWLCGAWFGWHRGLADRRWIEKRNGG